MGEVYAAGGRNVFGESGPSLHAEDQIFTCFLWASMVNEFLARLAFCD